MADSLAAEQVKTLKSSYLLFLSTCFLVAAASLFNRTPALEAAVRDLERLEELRENVTRGDNGNWLYESFSQATIAGGFSPNTNWIIRVEGSELPLYVAPFPSSARWITEYPVFESHRTYLGSDRLEVTKAFWNMLALVERLQIVEPLPYLASIDIESSSIKYEQVEILKHQDIGSISMKRVTAELAVFIDESLVLPASFDPNLPSRINLGEKALELLNGIKQNPNINPSGLLIYDPEPRAAGFFDFSSGRSSRLNRQDWAPVPTPAERERADLENTARYRIIPVTARPIKVNPMDQFLVFVPDRYGWKAGSFRLNFPELDRLSAGLQDLTIPQLRSVFEAELNRTGGNLELFGVSVSTDTVRRFGAIAALLAYVFFYAHFAHALSTWGGGKPDLPWIGLYPDWLAKTVFFLGAVVLPITIIALPSRLLAFWDWTSDWQSFVTYITDLLMLATAIATARATIRLWQLPIDRQASTEFSVE